MELIINIHGNNHTIVSPLKETIIDNLGIFTKNNKTRVLNGITHYTLYSYLLDQLQNKLKLPQQDILNVFTELGHTPAYFDLHKFVSIITGITSIQLPESLNADVTKLINNNGICPVIGFMEIPVIHNHSSIIPINPTYGLADNVYLHANNNYYYPKLMYIKGLNLHINYTDENNKL